MEQEWRQMGRRERTSHSFPNQAQFNRYHLKNVSLQLQVNTDNSALEIPVTAVAHCSAAGEQLPTTALCLSYFSNPQKRHTASRHFMFSATRKTCRHKVTACVFLYISGTHAAASSSRRGSWCVHTDTAGKKWIQRATQFTTTATGIFRGLLCF